MEEVEQKQQFLSTCFLVPRQYTNGLTPRNRPRQNINTDNLPENNRCHLPKTPSQPETNNNNKPPIPPTLLVSPARTHLTRKYETPTPAITADNSNQNSDTVPRIDTSTTAKAIRAHQSFEQYIYNQYQTPPQPRPRIPRQNEQDGRNAKHSDYMSSEFQQGP